MAVITVVSAVVFVAVGWAAAALLGLHALAIVRVGAQVFLAAVGVAVARRLDSFRIGGWPAMVIGVTLVFGAGVSLLASTAVRLSVLAVIFASVVAAGMVQLRRLRTVTVRGI